MLVGKKLAEIVFHRFDEVSIPNSSFGIPLEKKVVFFNWLTLPPRLWNSFVLPVKVSEILLQSVFSECSVHFLAYQAWILTNIFEILTTSRIPLYFSKPVKKFLYVKFLWLTTPKIGYLGKYQPQKCWTITRVNLVFFSNLRPF